MYKWVSDYSVFLRLFFLLLVCLVQPQCDAFCFILFDYFMFCCYFWGAFCFLMRDIKGVEPDGKEGGEEFLGGKKERGNCNQDRLYVKGIYFQ